MSTTTPLVDAAVDDMQVGLYCGVEDRSCQDRYEGADFGWSQGVERDLEWSRNEANHALLTFATKRKI